MSQANPTTIKLRSGNRILTCVPKIDITHNAFGEACSSVGGQLIHSDDGPAWISGAGEELYFYDGIMYSYEQYRERLTLRPYSSRMPNGATKRVWRKSIGSKSKKIHRTGGPAIECSDGSYAAWLVNGRHHRIGAPAIIIKDDSRHQELYYFNGKLHNPEGPAKVNHITKRNSYYLNGQRYSKGEFMRRRNGRDKIRSAVEQGLAYSAYLDAFNSFKTARHSDSIPGSILELIRTTDSYILHVEKRAAALGIYHALIRPESELTAGEFYGITKTIEADSSPVYVMDSGDTAASLFEVYLATFVIRKFDHGAVFTLLDEESKLDDIISLAIDHANELTMPLTKQKVEPWNYVEDSCSRATQESPSDIFSWTIPLAVAAGAAMIGGIYKRNKPSKKAYVGEVKCNQIESKRIR